MSVRGANGEWKPKLPVLWLILINPCTDGDLLILTDAVCQLATVTGLFVNAADTSRTH